MLFLKSLLLNVLHDFKGYVCLIWHLFSWNSAGSIPSISKERRCPGLNTGIDPTTTTTIRRFIASIRAEKFHLSSESMWKWNRTLILKFLNCLRNINIASLSGICLSFTILNTFENKKGVIKILVYRSVIDINQIGWIFFCNNYNWRLGAISVGCFTRVDEIITDFL